MKLFRYLAVLFIVIPIIEIYLFVQMGNFIGYLPSIALLILMAIFGTYLLRTQSAITISRLQQMIQQGELPTTALLEAILLLLSGVLLLAPGFFTDILGLLCLIPWTRKGIVQLILRYGLPLLYRRRGAQAANESEIPRPEPSVQARSTVIEGEFRREN